ncbi:XdhC family protein [Pendulispora albinea]|uniref:XdhC family protein n=1 Tax=Pendulispora albinea TaxID=2741071 RepID=A0ABZ2LYT5_9BACT
MNETQELLRSWHSLEDGGERMILATLVRTGGSSYRRAGARMLMTEQRWLAGGISGGCLEGDLLRKAWWHTEGGRTSRIAYDTTGDDDDVRGGFGLGCNGRLELLLEQLSTDDPVHPLRFIERCFTAREPGAMATIVRTGHLESNLGQRLLYDGTGRIACNIADSKLAASIERAAASALEREHSVHLTLDAAGAPCADGEIDVFVEVILPPRPLVVFGANYDVRAVVRQAKCVGWEVTVVARRMSAEAREGLALADRIVMGSPADVAIGHRTAVLVMTHNYESDRAILESVLPSPAPYIGILGPRARAERLLSEILRAGAGVTRAQLARVRAPVGLDLGADGPAEIALSMIAEIQSAMADGSARPLSEVKRAELKSSHEPRVGVAEVPDTGARLRKLG